MTFKNMGREILNRANAPETASRVAGLLRDRAVKSGRYLSNRAGDSLNSVTTIGATIGALGLITYGRPSIVDGIVIAVGVVFRKRITRYDNITRNMARAAVEYDELVKRRQAIATEQRDRR